MPGLCTVRTSRVSRSRLVKAAGSFPIIKVKLPSADPCAMDGRARSFDSPDGLSAVRDRLAFYAIVDRDRRDDSNF